MALKSDRILVVENMKKWRDAIADILDGFNLEFATNYQEAKIMLKKNSPYRLLIVNMNLNGEVIRDLLGKKLLEELRDMHYHAPRIIITGDRDVEVRKWLGQYQAWDLFFKGSFDGERFKAVVREALADKKSSGLKKLSRKSKGPRDMEYLSGVVAIEGMKGEMLGTGFVASYQKHHIVVTCAHVLRQGGYASGSTVKVIPFDPRCDGLSCKVVIVGPDTGDPLNFSALQDTALMKFTSSSSSSISPLLLTATSYARHKNCSFFGYGVEKGSKGDWRAGINCEGPVGKGFHKLTNTGEQPLCHGNSGSPLRARLGRIVGMVHSSQGPKNIFLIPSSAIVQVIKQYFQT